MQQKLQNTKNLVSEVFNKVYDKYDLMNNLMSLGVHKSWKKRLIYSINPKKNKKPVIVHTRSAKHDTLRLIKNAKSPSGGVLHCFTEDWEMAKSALDMGFYISFSGILTFKSASEIQEVARKIPLDRVLLETDSPYLAPVPYRGKPNLPEFVVETAKFFSEIRNVSFETICSHTTNNFFQLFDQIDLK